MKGQTLIKIIGLAATVVGAGATIVGDMVNEQKMKNEVASQVAKAVANKK